MSSQQPWYEIINIDDVDSPALVIYIDRVKQNIQQAIEIIGDVNRLRPHVKTHKSPDVTKLMMDAGITKFKCATIAEAEMLASVSAKDILLAYPVTGPKIQRWLELLKDYPSTIFSCLVDDYDAAYELDKEAKKEGLRFRVWMDINIGMNRTGIAIDKVIELFEKLAGLSAVKVIGLHIYDGHITNPDIEQRIKQCNEAFAPIEIIKKTLAEKGYNDLQFVAGGSPTFPIHAKKINVECSPGTFVFWDASYYHAYPEQNFRPAALVITRIISHPTGKLFCTDLGHKSIAAENPLNRRMEFVNGSGLECISQSEEHLVLKSNEIDPFTIGDILYAMPVHICPTCALYERAFVVEDHRIVAEWKIVARDRKIKI
ncbi:MAG: D-TA family PLP-dependent enzyme [Flavisolibacter sp.]